jgi:superfamily I DNA/RNA helicase
MVLKMSEQLIFGPPGCGKTYTLMEIIRKELEQGTPPDRIAFVSFSRKSIQEARERAGNAFALQERDTPYFRTLHSMGFKILGMRKEEIIGVYDLKQLGVEMGMVFDTNNVYDEDGVLQMSAKEGNKYLTLINRAHMRCVSLEQEYNDNGDYNIKWPLLEKLDRVYTAYKQETGKFDFTDMIKLMVEQGQGPRIDVLIVDEAQDLTPLQWEQVKVLKRYANRVWYAGDDDQAIFRYTGVDVRHMLGICDNIRVLDQSYRVPKSVHTLCAQLAKRISVRQPKDWNATDHEGSINYHMSVDEINMSRGSWTVMSRTSKMLNMLGDQLRQDGVVYTKNGTLSFDRSLLNSMQIWQNLQNGEFITVDEAKELYKNCPKRGDYATVRFGMSKTLDMIDPTQPVSYQMLNQDHGLLVSKLANPEDVVNLSKEDRQYLAAIKRRGEITTDPAVKLSTIHRMKGGEDENIVLLTDMGYLPHKTLQENPDDEHRVFYTAVTRTKENLHIVDSESKYRYPL